MNSLRILWFSCVAALICLAGFPRAAAAQENALRITDFQPSRVEMRPGQTRSVTIRGRNLDQISEMEVRTRGKNPYRWIEADLEPSRAPHTKRRLTLRATPTVIADRYDLYYREKDSRRLVRARFEIVITSGGSVPTPVPARPRPPAPPVSIPPMLVPPAPLLPLITPQPTEWNPGPPRPQVIWHDPARWALIGQTLTIEGRDFAPDAVQLRVGPSRLPLLQAAPGRLAFRADGPANGDLTLHQGGSETLVVIERGYRIGAPPVLRSVEPEILRAGDEVLARGSNLDLTLFGLENPPPARFSPEAVQRADGATTWTPDVVTGVLRIGDSLVEASEIRRAPGELRFRPGAVLDPATGAPLASPPARVSGAIGLPVSTLRAIPVRRDGKIAALPADFAFSPGAVVIYQPVPARE